VVAGRLSAVPVAYTAHEGALLVGTPFGWGRNLRTGIPVEVRYKGSRRMADVLVHTDEESVVEDYAVMASDNHQFARFNKIRLGDGGVPDPADLRLALVEAGHGRVGTFADHLRLLCYGFDPPAGGWAAARRSRGG